MIIRRSVILFLILVFAGCASQVTRHETAGSGRPVVNALQELTVEMSPDAKQQLADNVQFDLDALKSTLQSTLEQNNLIAQDSGYSLRVVVDDIRVRSTFNAVMWGFMAGNDHLKGEAFILNNTGEPIYSFEASASYALGGFGGGQDSARMNWLYEEFSKIIANEFLQKENQQDAQ